MLFRAAAVAAVVLLGSASAFAATSEGNLQIFKEIQKQVNRYAYFTIFDDVEAAIEDDGVVILSGSVTMSFKKKEIVKRVARVEGVTHVEDAIDVLPVSQFDNQLRYRVARAIYGNSGVPALFTTAAARAHRSGPGSRDADGCREQRRGQDVGTLPGLAVRRVLGHERAAEYRRGRSRTGAA